MAESPLVLTITAEDLASAVLAKVAAEVQRLAPAATQAATGLSTLGTATQKTTDSAGKLGQSVTQATTGLNTLGTSTQKTTDSASKLGQAVTQTGAQATGSARNLLDLSQNTEKSHTSFLTSAKSALAFGTAITGVQLGVQAVGQAVRATIEHVTGFETALANVATLGNNGREVQARFREEILKLPPALGDSITLAKGLYDVLSAGIAPANAVKFLAVNAELAKAGIADLGATTEATTKFMAAFKIPVEDAAQLADILFKTVDLGQGRLEAFARAFPQVTQASAAFGFSAVETAATMATLTQTFGNAAQAATGFRSLLAQLVQNSEKFAAVGINIVKVAGEQGVLGVLKALQDATGGNSQKLRELVNDQEGYNAALALTGPQYKLLIEFLAKYGDSLGVVAKGAKIQAETTADSFQTLTNELGKLADEVAPPFLTAFTAIAKGATLYAQDIRRDFRNVPASLEQALNETKEILSHLEFKDAGKTLGDAFTNLFNKIAAGKSTQKELIEQTIAAENAAQKLAATTQAEVSTLAELEAKYSGITGTAAQFATGIVVLTNTQEGLKDSLTKNTVELTEEQKAAADLKFNLDALNTTVKLLQLGDTPKIIDATEIQKNVDSALTSLKFLADSGQVNFRQLEASAASLEKAFIARFGSISPAARALFDDIIAKARAADLPGTFERIGTQSRDALQKSFIGQVRDFQAAVDSQQVSAKELLDSFIQLGNDLPKAGFAQIPLEAKKSFDQIPALLTQAQADAVAAGKALPAEYLESVLKPLEAVNKASFVRIGEDIALSGKKNSQQILGDAATTGKAIGDAYQAIGTSTTRVFAGLASEGQQAFKLMDTGFQGFAKSGGAAFSNIEHGGNDAFLKLRADGQRVLTNVVEDFTAGGKSASSGFTKALSTVGAETEVAFKRAFGASLTATAQFIKDFTSDMQLVRRAGETTAEANLAAFEGFAKKTIDTFGTLGSAAKAQFDLIAQAATGASGDVTLAFRTLGEKTPLELQRLADKALDAFEKIQTSGIASPREIADFWVNDVVPKILDAAGELPPGLQRINDKLVSQAKETGVQVSEALIDPYAQLGIRAPIELQRIADEAGKAFDQIAASGDLTQKELAKIFVDELAPRLIDGFGKIPPAWQTEARRLVEIARAAGEDISPELERGIGGGVELGVKRAAGALDALGQGLAVVGEQARVVFQQAFAAGSAGLIVQLRDAQAQLADIPDIVQSAFSGGNSTLESRAAYTKQLTTATLDAIELIVGKLKALGFDAQGNPLKTQSPLANPFDRLTAGAQDGSVASTDLASSLTSTNTTLQGTTTEAGKAAGSLGVLTGQAKDLASALALVPGKGVLNPNASQIGGNQNPNTPTYRDLLPDVTPGPVNPVPPTKAPPPTVASLLIPPGAVRPLVPTSGAPGQSAIPSYRDLIPAVTPGPIGVKAPLIGGYPAPAGGRPTLVGGYPVRPSAGDSLTLGGSGGSFIPSGASISGGTIDPLTGRPYVPGVGSLNPGRPVNNVQRFAQGGIVGGQGGVDSQLIRATPGERVQTPAQAAASDRVINITFGAITINVPAVAGGSSPAEMGRIAAQAFVTAVAPALNESWRRGNGEKFA